LVRFNFQFNDNPGCLHYNASRTNDGGEHVSGLTERQKKLAGEFQKAERSGIGPILAIYRREMDSWGNDCQKLVDLLCAMEARLDSPFSERVGTDDSIYCALADTIIRDPSINPIARVQAISLVMDRGLGKPEENIKIQHMEAERDEAQQRMDELFEEVRRKERGE
jgi:hypothetical protein